MEFHKLKDAVTRQFSSLRQHDLFCTTVERDDLWQTYLSSFPEGTNPIYRERTEHDCSCCRQFVKTAGSLVAVVDGQLKSIWDFQVDDPAYQAVADSMAALVKSQAIDNVFLHPERNIGTDKTHEAGDTVKTWDHFFVKLTDSNSAKNFYLDKTRIGPRKSETQALHDVLLRSCRELTMDAVDTVLELIDQNSLYRGDEHKFAVTEFRKIKVAFDKLQDDRTKDNFVWSKIGDTPGSVSKIRNTSIGTLLTDLSEGTDLEKAVRSFEAMVAPTNYKRPTALVTQRMVDDAKKTLEDLGLITALDRRYANLADISVNDIIFADRSAKTFMKGDVFSGLATKTSVPKNLDKVEEVTIEKFITDIVPKAESIEIMIENRHTNNLVSLVAPVDPKALGLFKWDNGFSWSYNGDVTDSIKERVKKAGGNVEGDLCCRLAWFNTDDLDFHMIEPSGNHIFYGNKSSARTTGRLDVDMNVGNLVRDPVENIFYPHKEKMQEGVYHLFVNNFTKRETVDVGFDVEIDFCGQVMKFSYAKAVASGGNITVAKFKYSKKNGIEMIDGLPSSTGGSTKTVWGVKTNDYARVNVMMLSPNHWDGSQVGNKHYFFMLDGCINEGQARGFYNEFLRQDLEKHRKVIEIVGSKMKTDETPDQLSGLGFSSTQNNDVLVRVRGSFSRNLKVTF